MVGSMQDSRRPPSVGSNSTSPPIPDITDCSLTACKNSGGNFVAIATVWTGSLICTGSLAMAWASGVTRWPLAVRYPNPSTSPSWPKVGRCVTVRSSGAGGGGGRGPSPSTPFSAKYSTPSTSAPSYKVDRRVALRSSGAGGGGGR
jgi:hypothetical protein